MAKYQTCDNVNCNSRVSIDQYGSIDNDEIPEWFTVHRQEKTTIVTNKCGEDVVNVVNEEFRAEYCSKECVIAGMKIK